MESNKDANALGVTSKQLGALSRLAEGASVEEAAESAGVSYRTVYRWLKSPDFRRAQRTIYRESLMCGLGTVQTLSSRAAQALARILDDDTASPASRTAAARSVLQYACAGYEIHELEERLSELEEQRLGSGDK